MQSLFTYVFYFEFILLNVSFGAEREKGLNGKNCMLKTL